MSDNVCMICGKKYAWCGCEGFQAHDHEIERLRARIEELEAALRVCRDAANNLAVYDAAREVIGDE